MELDRDFSEFIACCVERDVRFLIVGGYALAAHGHPRFTKDLLMAACGRAALLDGAGRRRYDGTGRAREIPLSAVCHAPDSADRHLTHLLVGSDVG